MDLLMGTGSYFTNDDKLLPATPRLKPSMASGIAGLACSATSCCSRALPTVFRQWHHHQVQRQVVSNTATSRVVSTDSTQKGGI